jgi:signal recognition particle receptor subunit beta
MAVARSDGGTAVAASDYFLHSSSFALIRSAVSLFGGWLQISPLLLHLAVMLSALLQGIPPIPGLNVDASGKIIGATAKAAKKVVKKAAKAATEQAAAAATNTAAATATGAAAASAAAEDVVLNASAAESAAAAAAVVDETPSALVEFLSSLDPVMTAAVLGLVLLVAFYIYRTRFSSTGQRGDTWLLLGPMGAGKTALFFRLKQGLFRPTQTSMKENDAVFVPQELQSASKGGAIAPPTRFVDLPGHPSQRVKLDALKPVAKGVVFVLDGAHTDSLGKTSQLLYTLLVDPIFVARRTPFFIAINKADLLENGASTDASPSSSSSSSEDGDDEATADSLEGRVEALTRRLEGLLDKTRSLQSTMSDLGDDTSASGPRVLGREGETFRLEHSICPIEVGAISAAKGTLEPLLEFLQAH